MAKSVGKTVALYLRVSTGEQNVENQRRELSAAVEHRGWRIVAEFVDDGISGANGRDKRPAFDRLHKAIFRHEFNIVAAWSVDRLGRSLQDLVSFLGEVHGAGVDLYLDRQGVDTSTLAGNGLFQMLGVTSDALIAAAQMIDRMRDLGDNKGPSCGGASSARRSGDPDHRRYFPPIRLFGDDRTASNHHLAVERRGDLARAGTEPIGNDSGASKSRCVHPVSRLRV